MKFYDTTLWKFTYTCTCCSIKAQENGCCSIEWEKLRAEADDCVCAEWMRQGSRSVMTTVHHWQWYCHISSHTETTYLFRSRLLHHRRARRNAAVSYGAYYCLLTDNIGCRSLVVICYILTLLFVTVLVTLRLLMSIFYSGVIAR